MGRVKVAEFPHAHLTGRLRVHNVNEELFPDYCYII
jgi:hypothetical protein